MDNRTSWEQLQYENVHTIHAVDTGCLPEVVRYKYCTSDLPLHSTFQTDTQNSVIDV